MLVLICAGIFMAGIILGTVTAAMLSSGVAEEVAREYITHIAEYLYEQLQNGNAEGAIYNLYTSLKEEGEYDGPN